VQGALINRFDLQTRYEVPLVEDARNALTKNSRISSGKDGLIVISVDDHDPAFAAQLANAYVEEFTRLLGKLAVTEAQQRRVFFEKQLAQAGDKLSQAQQALQAAGVNPDTLKLNPETAVEGVARLQAQITAQEVRVAAMRGRLTEVAPELRQALNELAALRRQLLRANQGGADDRGDGYVARLRDFKYHETLYELFARQYELARVDESREGAVVQVVDVAQAPERKSGPKRGMMVVFSSLMAGMVLLLFVFMRQAVRNAKSDPEAAGKLEKLSTTWRKVTGRAVV